MIRVLKTIYDWLVIQTPPPKLCESNRAIGFLAERLKVNPDPLFRELRDQVRALRAREIPVAYIENYCIGKLSQHILATYPLNIGEAYVLSYVLLEKFPKTEMVFHKLGYSGLLSPTIIKGELVADIERVSTHIIDSLLSEKLLEAMDNGYLHIGPAFELEGMKE